MDKARLVLIIAIIVAVGSAATAALIPEAQAQRKVCGNVLCTQYEGGAQKYEADQKLAQQAAAKRTEDLRQGGAPSGTHGTNLQKGGTGGTGYTASVDTQPPRGQQLQGQQPQGQQPPLGRTVVGSGGCLIATAAHGTEMVPQVQNLREIRQRVYQSDAGDLMQAVNSFYYSFSPAVSDMERASPPFREAVLAYITPAMGILSSVGHEGLGEAGLGAFLAGSAHAMIGLYVGLPVLAVVGARSIRGRE